MKRKARPVDLAAVAREREAMAATMRAHPELMTDTARKRGAEWIEAQTVKRLDPDAESVQLGVRIPVTLLAALDAEVGRLNSLAPGVEFSRSDAVRSILTRALTPGLAVENTAIPSRANQGQLSRGRRTSKR